MKFTLSLKPTEESASTIIRNVYENFRMLGDAILLSKGIESEDHLAPIHELIALKIEAERPLNVIDNLRRLRHNINYYGYRPNISEVDDVISIAKTIFQPLLKEIKKRLE